jgi:hypothetical protein
MLLGDKAFEPDVDPYLSDLRRDDEDDGSD